MLWRRWIALPLLLGLTFPAMSTVESDLVLLPPPEATITISEDGHTATLTGELGEGISARLAAIMTEHPGLRRLALTSEGGFVEEARSLGALVATSKLETYVPRYCVSACTLVFVRGSARIAEPGARLGFHAPYVTDAAGQEIQVDADDEREAYVGAGIDPGFAREALDVASSEIWFPDPDRLVAAGVVTRYASAPEGTAPRR